MISGDQNLHGIFAHVVVVLIGSVSGEMLASWGMTLMVLNPNSMLLDENEKAPAGCFCFGFYLVYHPMTL